MGGRIAVEGPMCAHKSRGRLQCGGEHGLFLFGDLSSSPDAQLYWQQVCLLYWQQVCAGCDATTNSAD